MEEAWKCWHGCLGTRRVLQDGGLRGGEWLVLAQAKEERGGAEPRTLPVASFLPELQRLSAPPF
jgi:hypothetical protein